MTDRVFSDDRVFGVNERYNHSVEFYNYDNDVSIEVDCGPNEWARFNLTNEEFQALFDWAKSKGIVK